MISLRLTSQNALSVSRYSLTCLCYLKYKTKILPRGLSAEKQKQKTVRNIHHNKTMNTLCSQRKKQCTQIMKHQCPL